MAVDNPSYFSLQGGAGSSTTTTTTSAAPPSRSFGSFFRRSKSSIGTTWKNSEPRVPQHPAPTISSQRNPSGHRRSLRNLFRSASTNVDSEKTRQFLKGEPMPTDVAPPSPYLNSRSHHFQSKSLGRNSRKTSELLNMDMVFCGLPGTQDIGSSPQQQVRRSEDNDYYHFERDPSECSEAATLPLDELEDDACAARDYYNVCTLPKGSSMYSSMGRRRARQAANRRARRHSIGTFLDRKPMVVEVAEPDHDGTRHAQPGAYAAPRVLQEQQPKDDVVFVSSKDSETSALWVNYLTACFEQISRQQGRSPFRVGQVTFEEPQSPATDLKIRNARLQIVVMCPVFLERVSERPEQAAGMTRQLTGDRVLAMMLGVQDAHLSVSQRANLVAYDTWRKFFVKDQDETFVGQFLGAAVTILGSPQSNVVAGNAKNDKIGFSVHPKKVKMGQNRILALLNEPLHQDDNVTVTVDRCGEALEISHVKRRNPYTLQFAIPERCLDVSMLVGVRIARNGAPLGVRQVKCESRLRELDQILRAHDNPLEFMCQTFGFNPGDKEQLDNWMVHAFQKNIPPHFNLLSSPPGDLQISKNHSSSEENPTLLHFAARFGLEKLAWQLLECPGAEIACDMKNVNDVIPADLAEQAGHVRLAHQLRGYMQMNEFSNMYSYLKVMSETTSSGSSNGHRIPEEDARQEDYCRPRPISEAYSVPPIARPVVLTPRTFPDYSTPPPPVNLNRIADEDEHDSSNVSTPMMPIYASTSTLNASSLDLPLQGLRSPTDSATPTPTSDAKGSDTKSQRSQSSKSSSHRSEEPQDELLEIITDFKNNVFTISEVERLVENWRNRNDVQQSFKDKQKQLSAMRDEYERIQKRMKDDMKASSTPFDRIRKFFSSNKPKKGEVKEQGPGTSEPATGKQPPGGLGDKRPVSSLSLHSVSSSTSSGRMSTVSGCSGTSLGDSGTHSDTDDRRLQHQISGDDKSVMSTPTSCYETPPAPKPFHASRLYNGGLSNLQSNYQHPRLYNPAVRIPEVVPSELDPRPVKSSYPTADDKEYYIAFPPSGLPVHSFKTNETKEPTTPDTPVETKSMSNNYANVALPPGMLFPYANPKENLLTVQPDIHAEPEDDDDLPLPPPPPPPPDSPKILNTEDYSNEAAEDISRNFGVTLKKLPPPPVPPRSEFSLPSGSADKTVGE